MDPMTMSMLVSAGSSILGGLVGGPSMPAGQRNLLRLQHRAAREMGEYARGVPGSDPGERAALASQRGLLGQQQRAAMGNMFGNLGASGAVSDQDMLANLMTQFQGQQSALTGAHWQNMLNARRNALVQSAQMAAGAVPASQMQQQQGPDLGAILGQLGQAYAFRQSMRQQPQLQQAQPGVTYGPEVSAQRTGPFGLQQNLPFRMAGGRGPFGF